MKKYLALICVLAVAGFASGCSNTFDGAGKDIERAGDKIQQTF